MILRLLTLLTLICSFGLHADLDPGVTFPNQGPYTPPPNPSPPPTTVTDTQGNILVPLLIDNNSGLSNEDVYLVVLGRTPVGSNPAFVKFETKNGFAGIGTLTTVSDGDNGNAFALPISAFQQTDGRFVAYIPFVSSGRVYFSFDNILDMPVLVTGIQEPSLTNTSLDNYNTIFDWLEFTYNDTVPQFFPNTTSVDQVSIPLYLYLHAPSPSSQCNAGFFQPRSYILSTIQTAFSAAPAATDWNKLVLYNTGMTEVLRIVSPPQSIPLNDFDPNYLDKSSGFSFLDFLWGGASPYYSTNDLFITIPAGSLDTYKGEVDGSKNFVFTNQTTTTKKVSFAPPTTAGPPTSDTTFLIFGAEIFPNTPEGGIDSEDITQLNKFLQELIIIGFVPEPTTSGTAFTLPGLEASQSTYYKVNTNLSGAGQSSGPWYSLYSQAIHDIAMQFSFAYDDALWPQTQLASPSVTAENQNFAAITIGPKGLAPAETDLTSSLNHSQMTQQVTFTTTVTSQSSTTTNIPTGTVTFSIEGVSQAPVALDGSGIATLDHTFNTAGTFTIDATYSGDATFEASTVTPNLEQTVEDPSKINTQTQLESDPTTTTVGEKVTFTATVLDGAQTPNGNVEFNFFNADNTIPSQTVALNSAGVAILEKTDLPVGITTVRAVYQGNNTFNTSSSNFVVQTVNEPGKIPTTTKVTSNRNPAKPGETITFTATANHTNIANPPLFTGSIFFSVNGNFETAKALVEGKASFSTNSLPEGCHTIVASYSGNADYQGSSSEIIEQIIDNNFPPKNARGVQKKNKYASQTEYVNRLIWYNPTISPLPIRYDIYRDINLSVFVDSVSGSTKINTKFEYFDRKRDSNVLYRYFIVAVYQGGATSPPTEIIINP